MARLPLQLPLHPVIVVESRFFPDPGDTFIGRWGPFPELMRVGHLRRHTLRASTVYIYRGLTPGRWTLTLSGQNGMCKAAFLVSATRDGQAPSTQAVPTPDGVTYALDEPGYLIAWSPAGGIPVAAIPDPKLGPIRLRFADGAICPKQGRCLPAGPAVLRPLDYAGNLGQAWLVDPMTGSATPVDAVEPYIWAALDPERP